MQNITYRTNFLRTVSVDDTVQKDLCSMDFGDFDFGDVQWYRCKDLDIGRPDRISKEIYGTSNYWWFLCWFNGISDVWNDIRENMMIKFPDVNLIKEAMKLYRKE